MKDVKDPRVKRDPSFSVILLRKDCSIGRFHVSSLMLKTLCLFAALFVCASGTAGYAAHYYWKKYDNLRRERSELTAEINEKSHQLSQFEGIGIIQEAQPPRSAMNGVPVNGSRSGMSTIPRVPATPPADTGSPVPGVRAESDPPANGHAPPASGGVAAPGRNADTGHATAPPADAAAEPETPPAAGPDGREPTPATQGLGANPASLVEVSVRSAGPQRVRISFGLTNTDPQQTLDGRITLAVTSKDGTSQEISEVRRAALRFLIRNYKKVETTFGLPDGVDADDVRSVDVTVHAKDLAPATFSYPLED